MSGPRKQPSPWDGEVVLVFADWKERPVRLGPGEGEAENDTGEGGRDQTQLGRSMDFNLCAKEAGAEFTREVKGTACFFIFIF